MINTELRNFLATVWRSSNGKILLGVLVTVATGLAESLSIMLLVPIIAISLPVGQSGAYDTPVIGPWLAGVGPKLEVLLLAFVALITLRALLIRMNSVLNQLVLQMIAENLRLSLFEAVSKCYWDDIRRRRITDIYHSLASDVERIIGAVRNGQIFVQSLLTLIIYVTLAALVSYKIVILSIFVGIALFAALRPLRRRASIHGQQLLEMYERQNSTIQEFISGVFLAKTLNVESQQVARYARELAAIKTAIVRFAGLSSWGTVAFHVGTGVAAALFVWLALRVYYLSLPELTLLLIVFSRLAPRFLSLQEALQLFLSELPAFVNYRNQKDFFVHRQEPQARNEITAPALTRRLLLRDVSVTLDGARAAPLSNVSIEIQSGQMTAVVGRSGSGKSTLGEVILGLTRPSSGIVLVDEETISDANRRAWRSAIASVPQDPFLMNDTIAANLRLAKSDASESEIWAALKLAHCDTLVSALPLGLDTTVGERGSRFSGGERQRIALARALLRKPSLLLLDEATSALDWESQTKIIEAITSLKGHMTIVTIAHRSSLVAAADKIIVLSEGRVVEDGTVAQLKARATSFLSLMLAADQAT